ncbi:heavy metal transporter [Streptomyces resistomycificus]|uniref:Co/Zn/Cd efflux system component n=1 Tax=Streptomyces resistomycificus TaxID=67356 RepID=A0A0L8KUT0_9ACTN|nr:Co/Zn/Cd efflux system component [Streptomyces resistomycificus]KUN98620.1 heavy metal transporter [Streptomyces resistomycificus]
MVLCAVAGYLLVQYVTGGAGTPGCKVVSGRDDGATYEFTPEQAVNAATIAAVGTGRGMPERAVTIALATALQESALRNIDHGDRDSLGLFQQRPSQGWGTPKEILDPTYSADIFYEHLAKVPDYTKLPLTVAAQKVQRSGYPTAYAKHEPDATLLAAALTGQSAATLTCEGRQAGTQAAGTDAVRTALVRDFGRDVLETTSAEVGAAATPTPTPTASTSGGGGRTVTLPVTADTGRGSGRGVRERGWQLAHWAVANASALHIERVSYAGRQWTAGNTDSQWRTAGSQDAKGGERAVGSVRIVTAQ